MTWVLAAPTTIGAPTATAAARHSRVAAPPAEYLPFAATILTIVPVGEVGGNVTLARILGLVYVVGARASVLCERVELARGTIFGRASTILSAALGVPALAESALAFGVVRADVAAFQSACTRAVARQRSTGVVHVVVTWRDDSLTYAVTVAIVPAGRTSDFAANPGC